MGLEKLWHDFPPILNSSWKILGHNKPYIFPYTQMFSAFFYTQIPRIVPYNQGFPIIFLVFVGANPTEKPL